MKASPSARENPLIIHSLIITASVDFLALSFHPNNKRYDYLSMDH